MADQEDDHFAQHPDDMKEEYEIYESVPLAEMEWDEDEDAFLYDCPCGDIFAATKQELREGRVILVCPTCSLAIKVIDVTDELLK